MNEPRLTLDADGKTDEALVPILLWILRAYLGEALPIEPSFVMSGGSLEQRVAKAIDLHEPDLLFIHRDSERPGPDPRYREIEEAIRSLRGKPPVVCVVPVRMTEAWLLFDERAIRQAASNPNGRVPISLPKTKDIETVPDPKAVLHDALRTASGQHGRRLAQFKVREHARRVVDYIDDFTPLDLLPAFRRLRLDLIRQMDGLISLEQQSSKQ